MLEVRSGRAEPGSHQSARTAALGRRMPHPAVSDEPGLSARTTPSSTNRIRPANSSQLPRRPCSRACPPPSRAARQPNAHETGASRFLLRRPPIKRPPWPSSCSLAPGRPRSDWRARPQVQSKSHHYFVHEYPEAPSEPQSYSEVLPKTLRLPDHLRPAPSRSTLFQRSCVLAHCLYCLSRSDFIFIFFYLSFF